MLYYCVEFQYKNNNQQSYNKRYIKVVVRHIFLIDVNLLRVNM